MDSVTAVDAEQTPWPAPPPRRRRWLVALVLTLMAAAVGGGTLVVRRFVEPRSDDDPPFDDEKKLRDRAEHPPLAVAPPKGITLPEVREGAPLPPQDLVLTVSKTMLALEGEDVVAVPADPRHGFDAKYKRSGPTDLYVHPLALTLAWARHYPSMIHRPAAMTLLVDRDIPYRLLVEVLFTLGQNEWVTFHLGAMHAGKVVGLKDTKPPRAGTSRPAPSQARLGLTVLIVPDGMSIKARGGNVAPGCQDTGPGIAIPKTAAGYDYAGLRACAAKLKTLATEFASETEAVISANPDTPYGAIVTTMDTLQSEALFPDIMFGIAR